MSEREYVVNFCDDRSSAFVRLAMAEATSHGANLREEIVRCRDCKYAHEVTWPAESNTPHDYLDCIGELVESWDYYNDEPRMNPVKPDGFCAWAKRRER